MLRCISVFFVVFICWSCEVDYSFGEKDFKPRVVVNALISPQEPFAVRRIGAAATRLKAGSLPLGKPKSACTKIIPRLCAARPIRRVRPKQRSGLLPGALTVLLCRSPAMASCLPDDDSRSARSPHIVRAPKGMVSTFRHDGPYCRRGCQSYLAPGYGTGQ